MFPEIIGLSRHTVAKTYFLLRKFILNVIFIFLVPNPYHFIFHIKVTHPSHLPVREVIFLQWELTQAVDLGRAAKIIMTRLIHNSWFLQLSVIPVIVLLSESVYD